METLVDICWTVGSLVLIATSVSAWDGLQALVASRLNLYLAIRLSCVGSVIE